MEYLYVVPWKSGKILLWDIKSPDTFAPSYSALPSTEAGMVAGEAEERKWTKYCRLATNHIFTPVAIETIGVIGPMSRKFIHELGHRSGLEQVPGDAMANCKSLNYLLQQLSINCHSARYISFDSGLFWLFPL